MLEWRERRGEHAHVVRCVPASSNFIAVAAFGSLQV